MRGIRVIAASAVVACAFAAGAQADNYGKVGKGEYAKNAALVYGTFASRYGADVGREMVRCMNRESGGNARAANWGDSHPTSEGTFKGSFGLLQIGALHAQHTRGVAYRLTGGNKLRLWNARINVEAGLRLFASDRRSGGRGFKAWGYGC